MNLLTKFHEDWTINVASRVKNAPPLDSHFHEDWKINVASIEKNALPPGINGTNVLTKFHEDRTINEASRVFTRQNVDNGRRTTDKRRSQKLTMSTLCSGELKITITTKMKTSKSIEMISAAK
ncbi:hypothetical protein DPMN_105766 [Dreissena polymorpha]|uniref:Uncharacterized protein n=1 Tax=Dreissena polymorpha TaxID=45954 RepID=A0A9D4K3S1_DREPO|nr:hypothetical protein DPMN_105766 [Dreissena polymorpha]